MSTPSPIVLASSPAQQIRRHAHRRTGPAGFDACPGPYHLGRRNRQSPRPTPKALEAFAAAMVRTLASARTELAAKIRNSR